MSLSDQLYKKLEDASNDWAEWQKKTIILGKVILRILWTFTFYCYFITEF